MRVPPFNGAAGRQCSLMCASASLLYVRASFPPGSQVELVILPRAKVIDMPQDQQQQQQPPPPPPPTPPQDNAEQEEEDKEEVRREDRG